MKIFTFKVTTLNWFISLRRDFWREFWLKIPFFDVRFLARFWETGFKRYVLGSSFKRGILFSFKVRNLDFSPRIGTYIFVHTNPEEKSSKPHISVFEVFLTRFLVGEDTLKIRKFCLLFMSKLLFFQIIYLRDNDALSKNMTRTPPLQTLP